MPAKRERCTAWQQFQIDIAERHRSMIGRDENGVASDSAEPCNNVFRIRDAAAEEQKLRGGRCERRGRSNATSTVLTTRTTLI